MNKGLIVLSLFDGMSCGLLALDRSGIKVDKYFASEIKKHAIKCSKDNFGDRVIHIGDVTKVSYNDGILYTENGNYEVGKIDLLIGGSPCQDFSILNTQRLGLDGLKSRLFYEYLRIKNEINPTYFLLENVKMKNGAESELNKYLGVNGIHINSKLVSFQSRPRIYWTNIPNVTQPNDKNISFQDYIGIGNIEQSKVNKTPSRIRMWNNGNGRESIGNCDNVTNKDKIGCLTRKQDRSPNSGLIEHGDFCRFLTRRELEAAQTIPYGYTDCVSYSQAQDLLGDGWTVDVISHIFNSIK